MKKYLVLLVLFMMVLGACNQNASNMAFDENSFSSNESTENFPYSDTSFSASESIALNDEAAKTDTSDRDALLYEAGIGGGVDMCQEHNPWYHTVPVGLINYVGDEASAQWEREMLWSNDAPYQFNEEMTIQNFITHFGISREVFMQCVRPEISSEDLAKVSEDFGLDYVMTASEYYNQFSFTDEEIDALYSGDQAQINEAFCGPLAYFNEADGQLYSIYWLADHTAEEYLEAGLPLDAVEEILTRAQEDYELVPAVTSLAESVEETYASAVALEEAALEAAASEETLPVSEETETAE